MSNDASLNFPTPPIKSVDNIEPIQDAEDVEGLVDTDALADLVDIIEEESSPIDPKGVQEITDLLNANLHNRGGMDYTRISEIQRAHLLMRSVSMSYSQGELNSQMDSKPAIVKKERYTAPIVAGYSTTTEEVTELYMDMRARTLQNIDNLNIDTTLNLVNMAARLGDVEAMNVALGRMSELGTTTQDNPASNELFFDTLAIVIDESGKLDPENRAQIEPTLKKLIGNLSNSQNIEFNKLPESIWPFLVAVKEMRNDTEYMLVLHALFEHVTTSPQESTNSVRRELNRNPYSPYYGIDRTSTHVYRGNVIQNYPKPSVESIQAYRESRGVRGELIPFEQGQRQTSELVVDTWLKYNQINPQKPGVIHL